MSLENRFKSANPNAFFLDENAPQKLQEYLIHQQWIPENAELQSLKKAGEGNMNKVLRIALTDGQRFIIKQARPWVEKFPDIPAPQNRANIEGKYYRHTAKNATIARFSPELLHADPQSHVLLIEDLGEGTDLTYLYEKGETLQETQLQALMEYISALHGTFTQATADFYIENKGMRKLNAEHIFRFPFIKDNGLNLDDITPGLADIAARYRSDDDLMDQISFLQHRYMQNGSTLLQGDFYPGSFLQTEDGINVIDPEFCYFGDAEFDLGIFYAHMLMAGQPEDIIRQISDLYNAPNAFSTMLYEQYAGIEILRRLLGLAQLPLTLNFDEKKALLSRARTMLLQT